MDDVPAAQEQGIPTVEQLSDRVNELVQRLLQLSPRPTGLFVPNDMFTALCYVALRKLGVEPGRDLQLISCNNEQPYLLGLDPRQATIDIGAELIGRRTVTA